jgi:hypothetical protein
MITCVIFDVTNSIMPNRAGMLLERLRNSNPSAHVEMSKILKDYYYGSNTKEFLKQSFWIKLGLSQPEASELDVTLERVEQFFGPVVKLLSKKGVQVVLVGNTGHEDGETYTQFEVNNNLQSGVYSYDTGTIFGLDNIQNTFQLTNLAQNNSTVVVTSDKPTAEQFSVMGITPIIYTSFDALVRSLFTTI